MQDYIPILSLSDAPSQTWNIGDNIRITHGLASGFVFPPEFHFRDFMIVYLKKGRLAGKRNGVDTLYKAPSIIMIQPGNIYEFGAAEEGTDMLTISYSALFTERLNLIKRFGLTEIFIKNPSLELDETMCHQLEMYINRLVTLGKNPENPYLDEALIHLTLSVFYGVGYQKYQVEQYSRSQQIADEFVELVNQYGANEHQINFYADKMRLSPKYIQSVVKNTTGRTAYAWIEDVVIQNAKQLLHDKRMTLQQISAQLNFCDQSYFGAFFKRHVGMTPKQYRSRG